MTDRDQPPPASLEDVLITDKLSLRPSRPPGYEGEAKALAALARELSTDPDRVLLKLVELVPSLCRADSAGVSLLDPERGDAFRWAAVGGTWASHAGSDVARDATPCGVVVERDRPLLFDRPGRFFRGGPPVDPAPAEALLVPFHADGEPIGTVWAVSHDPGRKFDAEDVRLLTSLSSFAAATRHVNAALAGEREARALVERDSQSYARSIVDTVRDPLLILDADLRVIGAGMEFYRTFGLSPEETEGVLVYELGNRQWDIPRLRTLLEEVLPREAAFRDFEVEHTFERIGRKVMLLNAKEVHREEGERRLILLAIEDVTERRDAEKARREAEARFTEMVKNVHDHSIFLTDTHGVITSWNAAADRILGYTEAEAVGRHISLIYTPEDVQAGVPEREILQAREQGRAEDERWHVRKGGERFWALGIVTPLHDPAGLPSGFSKILRDMTERKRAEDRRAFLLKLNDATRPLDDAVEVASTAVRLLGRHLGANRVAYAEDVGDGRSFDVTSCYVDGAPDAPGRFDYADFGRDLLADLQAGRTTMQPDIPNDAGLDDAEKRALAGRGIVAALNAPLVSGGRLVAFLGVGYATAHDFHEDEIAAIREVAERTWEAVERARARATSLEGERFMNAVLDSLPAEVAVLDQSGTIRAVNEPWLRFARENGAGSSSRVAVGVNYLEVCGTASFLGDPTAGEVVRRLADLLAGRTDDFLLEYPCDSVEGRRWFVMHAVRPTSGLGGAVVTHTDITLRKRAEHALSESEGRLRLALSAARMGVWTLDLTTGSQTRDANLNGLLGLEHVESVQPFEEFLDHVHPDDRRLVRGAFAASSSEAQPLSVEFRIVRPGQTVRWLRDQGDVFGDAAASTRRMAGACVDVTVSREAEDRVKASEERLRLIVESATDYGIFTLAPDRTVTSWSPGAAAAFGYAEGEMLGRPGDVLFTPPDRADGAPEAEARTALRDGRAADERWHVRKDGSTFYASGVLTPLGEGGSLGFVKVLRDLTDRKRTEDQLREAHDILETRVEQRTAELVAALGSLEAEMSRRRELARRLSSAQEDERRRVSKDLHDSVGQLMTGLSLALKSIETTGGLTPPALDRLTEAQDVVNEMGRELHGLAVRLRPTALDDFGLVAALGQLVTEWSSRTGVRAEFDSYGLEAGRLSAEAETAVYRVVQEALTNVAKHARADIVSVVAARPGGSVTVVIEDDGAGFDLDAVPGGRLGLSGMRERVEQVGGTIRIESSPRTGTTIAITIPTEA